MQIDVENLGDLELAALDYLWNEGPSDVETVHEAVGDEREITSNTVQSALKRLWEKGILQREKESYAYVYEPKIDRRTFAKLRISGMVDELMSGELDPALEAFVDVADNAGDEKLDAMETLIEKRRSDQEDD